MVLFLKVSFYFEVMLLSLQEFVGWWMELSQTWFNKFNFGVLNLIFRFISSNGGVTVTKKYKLKLEI